MDAESESAPTPNAPIISNALSILSYSFPLCPVPPPTPTQAPSLLTTSESSQTIPLYQLQQTPTDFIAQNSTSKLYVSTNDEENNRSDWSLIKPASRFANTNRRECKSTSDDTFTFDLSSQATTSINQSCLISPNRSVSFNLVGGCRNKSISSSNNDDWLLTSVNSINSGRFGFNPVSFSAMSTSLKKSFNEPKFKLSSAIGGTSSASSHAGSRDSGKKTVKRLNSNSKHSSFVDGFNKKHNLDYNHNKKLFHAISNNDYSLVADLLDSNLFDVNCYDDKQRTCLHIASSKGNLEIVRLLLNYGANPNLRDCVNNLPIHLAIISSHVAVVTLLLEAGTDIHSLDLNGKTVLHLAGTRLRWLLNDENNKASPKLKFEAIMIMNMIKEYLRRKKTTSIDLDILSNKLENVFTLEDINSLTKEFMDKFETLNL